MYLSELMEKQPIVPYIRESDYAVRKPWLSAERRLLDYLLVYFQEGECVFQVDGVPYEFRRGDFCLIQPNVLNVLEGKTNTITPFAHMDFFYDSLREDRFPTRSGQIDLEPYSHLIQPRLNDFHGVTIPVRLQPKHPIALRDKFLAMVECWQHRDPLMQLRAQSLGTEVILTILEDHTDLKQTEKAAPQRMNWITSFLSLNLAEPLTVSEMAARANLSPSRFSAKFKEQLGVSPHRYLLQLRIHHAQELLTGSDNTIEEIAAYCGFADVHHFTKAFKKEVGEAPGQYRSKRCT
ncbi:AraC family transcriptional regulator [Paenibacillus sp. CF384]|uniref:AraC family transcriptional regulator n=1 Tax=Paenibacillus sp. CF384 TaxID=1884382 RepID=UPI0008981697|nr:AraC family transcriptional regulator [Paenibacillus sp. CF384]SDX67695.1 AraC-like ligand binding domain-containing protein [Paenibacillus sp. CF384]